MGKKEVAMLLGNPGQLTMATSSRLTIARAAARFSPIPQRFSRAVEFKVNPDEMTVEQVWTTGDTAGEEPYYSDALGDAYRLPHTGNRLVVFAMCSRLDPKLLNSPDRTWNDSPFGGRVIEYDGEEIVLRADIHDEDQIIQWEVYRSFRRHWLY